MASVSLGAKNELLNKMLRDTTISVNRFLTLRAEAQGPTHLWWLNSLPWNAPVDGMAALNGPVAMTVGGGAPVYPITKVYAQDVSVLVSDLSFSDGAPAECVFSDLDGPGVPVVSRFSVRLPKMNGSVKLSSSIVTSLLRFWLAFDVAKTFAAAGTIKVYTGAEPASADDPATGTELLSFATTTATWSASGGNASVLAAALNSNGLVTGTAGYVRHSWVGASIAYTIQGSVGSPGQGKDYTLDSLNVVQGQNRSLVDATYRFA